jgi:hypothetical protein
MEKQQDRPKCLLFDAKEVDWAFLEYALQRHDTSVLLLHKDHNDIGFVYDSGLASQRAKLIALYLYSHKETILPLVKELLGLQQKWLIDDAPIARETND